MSRSEKRRKRQRRDELRSMTVSHRTYAPQAVTELERAERFIDDGQYDAARQILEDCDRAEPGRGNVLSLLLQVYQEQEAFDLYSGACERMLKLLPDNRELQFNLAGSYMCSMRPTRALGAFRRFLQRWPDDPLSERAREGIAELEPLLEKMHARSPFKPDERFELVALHEDILASVSADQPERTIELCEQLLTRAPTFIPAMNNLAHALFGSGRADEALAMSRRVLEHEPQNFQALGNLARHLLLTGRGAEARLVAAELRNANSEHEDIWAKKAETFSFLGDDAAVLEALAGAREAGCARGGMPQAAMLFHLAGVANARLGNAKEARRCWRDALKAQPKFELAAENLADFEKPVSERNGPWPYSLNYWLPRESIESLHNELLQAGEAADDSEEARLQAAMRVMERHPRVRSVIPCLLDRGDALGREFAVRLARLVASPELLEMLRDFCLSPRGPDALRFEVANFLVGTEVLPAGPVSMWVNGRIQELELLGFTITDEPFATKDSHEVMEWTNAAVKATHRGDGKTAERLLKQVIAAVGERPSDLNNLAMAFFLQEKTEEGKALARQVHERWPEYFFGAIFAANSATINGDYDQAEELLQPLRRKKQYHRTEFTALCTAQVQLLTAQRAFDGARYWLDMWKQVDPDHRDIGDVERQLKMASAIGKVTDFFGGRRRDARHRIGGPSTAESAPVAKTPEAQRGP